MNQVVFKCNAKFSEGSSIEFKVLATEYRIDLNKFCLHVCCS